VLQSGCRPAPIPLNRLTVDSLAAGLKELAAGSREGGSYSAAARAVAEKLAREDGLSAAVRSVLRLVG